jgi:release factor glutamine methyltransferase
VTERRTWQLIDVLRQATTFLESKGIENARLNAERLMGHVLQLPRMELYLRFDQPLRQQERDVYKSLLRRRADHEPIQYILGSTEFMSLSFKVTLQVLIPRPETEVLVEKALSEIPRMFGSDRPVSCLDIGTGCGNIAVSMATYLKNVSVTAIDRSEPAVKIATENAQAHDVLDRIDYRVLDVFASDLMEHLDRPFDVLVSNPPYVTASEYKNLPIEIREFEPKLALEAGSDGTLFYRRFAQLIPILLKRPGLIILEIGENQAGIVRDILSLDGIGDIHVGQDLAGRDRIVICRLS